MGGEETIIRIFYMEKSIFTKKQNKNIHFFHRIYGLCFVNRRGTLTREGASSSDKDFRVADGEHICVGRAWRILYKVDLGKIKSCFSSIPPQTSF